MTQVPKWLQPVLWSVNVKNLDLEKNKPYIINQILALGSMKALKWLFKTYSKKTIKQTFVSKPLKVYTSPAFKFTKEILLTIKDKNLDLYKYDISLPRIIRR